MTRVKYGKVSIKGYYKKKISYSGFSGAPSVCVTVTNTKKQDANAYVRDVTAGGCLVCCYYNGGMELKDCTVLWIAVGPTNEKKICHCPLPYVHVCHPDVYG